MPFRCISLNQALEIHDKTIDVSGGGSKLTINHGQLGSVLAQIQNDDYYPEFIDKITHLFFCSNKFHCFQDGNKRIALSLSTQFLLLNGYVHCAQSFIREMENISYHVAAGKIDKPFLREIINAVIHDNFNEDEELKLRIINATDDTQVQGN
jgi:death on curing protein